MVKLTKALLLLVMIVTLSIPVLAAPAEALEEVLSVTAITDSIIHSQKLKAMVVEYKDTVDPASLSLDTYEIQDLEEFGLSIKSATITAVYTNNEASMTADKKSVPGKFVVVEIDDHDGVGRVICEYYYYTDAEGKPASARLFPRPDAEFKPTIEQLWPIRYTNEATVFAWGEKLERGELIHLKYREFKDLFLSQQQLPGAAYEETRLQYYLPPSYGKDPNRLFPTVFVGCGSTLRYQVIQTNNGPLDNHGASVLTDQQVSKWLNNPYEECIVVVPHYRRDQDYPSSAADVNLLADYFVKNFKADPNRLYYSGNSYGSNLGFSLIGQRPDLWAGVMLCNGLGGAGDPYTTMLPALEQKVPVIFQLGRYDGNNWEGQGIAIHKKISEFYSTKFGMTQEEIDKILQLNVYYAEDYFPLNLIVVNEGSTPETRYKTDFPYYHAATKLVYAKYTDQFMLWLFRQVKK